MLIAAIILFAACSQNNEKRAMENSKEQTVTYGVGRFVIDIPISMRYSGGTYPMRYCDLKEVIWPDSGREKAVEAEWRKRLNEIEALTPPEEHGKVIIAISEIKHSENWCRGVFYYGDKWMPQTGYWDILVVTQTTGLWIKLSGDYEIGDIENKNTMWDFALGIAKAYRPPVQQRGMATVLKGIDSFYLRYGAIDLPFEYKESVTVGFKGHALDKYLELDIETEVVLNEVEETGLMDKLKAIIATSYAPGLKIDKIRTQKRIIAGMHGEEVVYRTTQKDDNEKELYFKWEFAGKKDDPHNPNVIIDMQSQDSDLDEKIALWDSILNTIRLAGR